MAVTRSQSHLVVTNFASDNVALLSLTEGHVVQTFGTRGSAQGQFDSPFGVSVDPHQGHLWVADFYNNRVQLFTEEGHFIRLFPCCQQPASVAFLSNGDVVVASRHDNKLHVYSPEGAFRRSIGTFGALYQLAVVPPSAEEAQGGEDHLAVADYSTGCVHCVSITDSGHVVRTLATTVSPCGVVVTPNQYVIVVESDRHGVGVFSQQGERVHQWGSRGRAPGQFDVPRYCALLSDGRVAIADRDNHRIQLF